MAKNKRRSPAKLADVTANSRGRGAAEKPKKLRKVPPQESGRVELSREGLRLVRVMGGEQTTEMIPLRAGAMHYFRLDPYSWREGLRALVAMELKLVETYIPWQAHERVEDASTDGEGARSPQFDFTGHLDVAAFLREAHALGLKAIVRPGPHINAELTDFGIPERVLWNPACQARTPRQNPVILPAPPRAFPVPSYASRVFLDETARWFAAVGNELRDLVWPKGPIVLVQIDNEGAFYFRDGVYDQDYHPDALTQYRAFLKQRYSTIGELRRVYYPNGQREGQSEGQREAHSDLHADKQTGARELKGGGERTDAHGNERGHDQASEHSFDTVLPPDQYDVQSADDLPRHLDWAESHEVLLANAFADMQAALARAGLGGVPCFHNLPMGESATPLHPSFVRRDRKGRGLDLIALDYYHSAGDHRAIARRTSELVVACEALDHPAFAAEMGAGAPPFFPPLDERDAAFTVLCAMAYGLRGYNVYMAVERDRWLGSPIDSDGVMRPFAGFWKKLGAAFDRVRFGELLRDTPARLVIPRSIRRLARVMHAFGPVSQALFRVMGGGLRETVLEDAIDFGEGHGEAPPMRAGRMLVAAERALEEEGIAYALVDSGDASIALGDAKWIFLPTSCGVDPKVTDAIRAAARKGAQVTFAPSEPLRDDAFRMLAPSSSRALQGTHLLCADDALDVATIRAHLHAVVPTLPRIAVRPTQCAVTVHRNVNGAARVVFILNPTKTRQRLTAIIPGVKRVRDLIDGTVHDLEAGVVNDANTVRFCEVEG
ncbi:MAG: hypothetical protein NVSMB1_11670 [Polyangiales bacterium]